MHKANVFVSIDTVYVGVLIAEPDAIARMTDTRARISHTHTFSDLLTDSRTRRKANQKMRNLVSEEYQIHRSSKPK